MGFKMRGWSPMTNKAFKGGGDSRSMPSASPLERRKSKRQRERERELKDFHGKNYKYIYEDKWKDHDEKRGITHEFDEEGKLIRRNREGNIFGGTQEQRQERNAGRVSDAEQEYSDREYRKDRIVTTDDTREGQLTGKEFAYGDTGGRMVIDDKIENEIYSQIRSGDMSHSEAEYWTRTLAGKKSGKNLTIDFREDKPTRGIHTYDDVGAAASEIWKGGHIPTGSVDRIRDIAIRLNSPRLKARTGFEDLETTPTLAPRSTAPSDSTTETGRDTKTGEGKLRVIKRKVRKVQNVEKKETKENKEKKEKKKRGGRSDWAAGESYIPQSQRGDA